MCIIIIIIIISYVYLEDLFDLWNRFYASSSFNFCYVLIL
jgi:hypothetical protein